MAYTFRSEITKMDSARSQRQSAILNSDRLILRRWRDSDREPFARMNADTRVMEFFAARLSREDSDSMVDKIESHFGRHGFGLCAAELRQHGTFIGFIGMAIPDFEAPFSVELGWRLAAEYWGYGLGHPLHGQEVKLIRRPAKPATRYLAYGLRRLGRPRYTGLRKPAPHFRNGTIFRTLRRRVERPNI